tara:strand:- start:324 stop:617 length:294 start_codon:yes stop_codon:yes gene_type:complete
MHINYLKNYLLGAEIKAINFPTISICDSMIVDVNNHEDIYWLEICKNDKNSILLCNLGKGSLIITDRSQIEFDSVKKITNKELMNVIQKKYSIDQTS